MVMENGSYTKMRNAKTRGARPKDEEPSQITPKPNIHEQKFLLSPWWNYSKGINSEGYYEQLTKLNESWLQNVQD